MNIYGVKGYLTPDDIPDDSHCRTFKIPNSTQWLSVFMGALLPLIYSESWQEYGDLTPDEAADAALAVIWDAYNNNTCPLLEAPYWDDSDADDADDEAPADDQPWYGELVPAAAFSAFDVEEDDPPEPEFTWQENASIWIVTAFVAYAATPAAAIAFYPIARKFVLAFKAHDLGGIVKVLWDGEEIVRVDTYSESASVVETSIILPDTEDMPPLWVAMADEVNPAVTGEPNIQVLRKRLAPDQVSPTNLRYNVDCDCVQQTYDGGDTWIDNPGQDPRHSVTYQFPPVGGDDPKCQAAANQVRFLNNVIDETLSNIAIAGDALSLALTILPFIVELGPFAILFDLVLALAGILISAGATAINAAFTNDVYDQLLCIFYCAIEDDGTVTADDLAEIETKVGEDIGGLVQVVIDAMLLVTGEVGMTNEGTIGDAPADCSDCECTWEHTVDLTTENYAYGTHDHFYIDVNANGSPTAFWNDGLGFGNRNEGSTDSNYLALAWIVLVFTQTGGASRNYKVTHIEFETTEIPTGYSQCVYFDSYSPDTEHVLQDTGEASPVLDMTFDYSGSDTTRAISMLQYQQYPHDPREVYTGYITRINISGTGDDPMPEMP